MRYHGFWGPRAAATRAQLQLPVGPDAPGRTALEAPLLQAPHPLRDVAAPVSQQCERGPVYRSRHLVRTRPLSAEQWRRARARCKLHRATADLRHLEHGFAHLRQVILTASFNFVEWGGKLKGVHKKKGASARNSDAPRTTERPQARRRWRQAASSAPPSPISTRVEGSGTTVGDARRSSIANASPNAVEGPNCTRTMSAAARLNPT